MATWHQMKRGLPQLRHETQWTVVENPPNGLCTLARFSSRALAEEYLTNAQQQGNGAHCYILNPTNPPKE